VEAGELSKVQAEARMEGLKKRADMSMKGEDKDDEFEAFVVQIRSAVEDGTMTREEAGRMIEAYKKRIGRGMRNNQPLRPHRSVMQ